MNCNDQQTSPILNCIRVNGQPLVDYINTRDAALQQSIAANAAASAANVVAIAALQSSLATLSTCCTEFANLATRVTDLTNLVNTLTASLDAAAGNTIEIPFDAFADRYNPTQAEAQNWIDTHQPHAPGTLIIYGTDLTPDQDNRNPGWVWLVDSIGDAIALKFPERAHTAAGTNYDNSNSSIDQPTVQGAIDALAAKLATLAPPVGEPIRIADSAIAQYNDPTDTEVEAWILATHPAAAPGQTFIYSTYKALTNPDFIWTKLGNTIVRTKELPFVSHEIDGSAFADPANPTVTEAQAYINARAPHLPGSFWVYPGHGDETDPDLIFLIDSIGDPVNLN